MLNISLQHRLGAFTLDVKFHMNTPITGVFGPSGAGKTTLMHLIAGLEHPGTGRIQFGETVLFDSATGINIPANRRRIGVVFQEHRLFPHKTVSGNLRYGLRLVPVAERRWSLNAIADLLELAPLLNRGVGDLSGGERQRVAIGRALLSSPKLLLLDEPLASLDRRLKQQVLPFLERVRDQAGIPMLYVSHDHRELLRMTSQFLLLERGRIHGHGQLTDLMLDAADAGNDSALTNILSARVLCHHLEDGVSSVNIEGTRDRDGTPATKLIIPLTEFPIGSLITVAIRPVDISLAVGALSGLSIQNQLPATVRRVNAHEHCAMVELDIGCSIVAEITRRSVVSLDLHPGRMVSCLVKSQAIRCLSA